MTDLKLWALQLRSLPSFRTVPTGPDAPARRESARAGRGVAPAPPWQPRATMTRVDSLRPPSEKGTCGLENEASAHGGARRGPRSSCISRRTGQGGMKRREGAPAGPGRLYSTVDVVMGRWTPRAVEAWRGLLQERGGAARAQGRPRAGAVSVGFDQF